MDEAGDHFLNSEYCFFDGKRKRCRDFVTLTASVYHPLLRKQVPLATMETEKEDTENIELFWTLFNEAISKATGNPDAVFNPVGHTDMAGANMAGFKKVFGEASVNKIKSCEFHFKYHRNQKARKLSPESKLLHSVTEDGYQAAKSRMDAFVAERQEHAFLASWVSWWHDRRGFIFRAFAPQDSPQMNQAEVIHAGWVNRDRQNLSLLDVSHADTRDALQLETELEQYEVGVAPRGRAHLIQLVKEKNKLME